MSYRGDLMARMTTKQIALTSIFAALIVIITRIPGIPIIGGSAKIELSVFLYPVIGIVLGPLMGLVASLIGNLIAWIIPSSSIFGLLLIPAGAVSAFVSGCLSREFRWLNWKTSALVLAVLNGLWYLTPVGFEAPFYPILHLIALAIILIFRSNVPKYIRSSSREEVVLGMVICSYSALMADHMIGNLAWISSIGLVVPLKAVEDAIKALGMIWLKAGIYIPSDGLGGIFMAVLPISAVERIIYTIVSTILGVALIRVVGWSRLFATTGRPIRERNR
jgi:uncharacterized membrane protein